MSKNLYIISGCNGAGKTNGSKGINLSNGMLTLFPSMRYNLENNNR